MDRRSLLRQLTRAPLVKPCDSSWEEMVGSSSVRHCASCQRDVYSLSEMSALEAEIRLLNAADEVPCIRYARDETGEVMHQPAWIPPQSPRSSSSSAAARAFAVASALGTSLVAQEASADGKDKKPPPPVQCVMLTPPAPATPAPAPASGNAAAGAAAPTAAAAPSPPPEPPMMGGAAPPPDMPVVYGVLFVKSKVARTIKINGLQLQAPLANFRFTPGTFSLEVIEGAKTVRTMKLVIKDKQSTTIDLDKK